MSRFIIVVVLGLVASAVCTEVSKCSNNAPFPLSVVVHGCDKEPCDVVKGSSAVMDVHFVGTKDNIRKLTTKVRATALGVTVPYVLPDDVADVCSNLMYGALCPIDKTEDVVYKFNFYVDNTYPEISVKVQVSLVDEDNETITCFSCNIKVKKGDAGSRDAPLALE